MSSRGLLPDSSLGRTFFFSALIVGLLYAVVNPPFSVNDERHHMLRVYELANGQLLTNADQVGQYHMAPREYRRVILYYWSLPKRVNMRANWRDIQHDLVTPAETHTLQRMHGQAGSYTPIPYAPHVPPLWLAREMELPALWHLYLPRIASVLCFALLGSWAVALAGALGWPLLALGLMPMALTQAAGLSGDGVTNGLSLLYFALIARSAVRGVALSKGALCLLMVLVALLALCKPTYLLLGLALPALHWEGQGARWRRWTFAASSLALATLALAGWAYLNRGLSVANPGHPQRQLAWMLADPAGAFGVALRTMATQTDDLLIQFAVVRDIISRQLYALGLALAVLYFLLLLGITWGAAAGAPVDQRTRKHVTGWLVLTGSACGAAIFVALYLTYSDIHSPEVRGVQGRYFIPVAPALLIALGSWGGSRVGSWLASWRGLLLIYAFNVLCLLILVLRYYVSPEIGWLPVG